MFFLATVIKNFAMHGKMQHMSAHLKCWEVVTWANIRCLFNRRFPGTDIYEEGVLAANCAKKNCSERFQFRFVELPWIDQFLLIYISYALDVITLTELSFNI